MAGRTAAALVVAALTAVACTGTTSNEPGSLVQPVPPPPTSTGVDGGVEVRVDGTLVSVRVIDGDTRLVPGPLPSRGREVVDGDVVTIGFVHDHDGGDEQPPWMVAQPIDRDHPVVYEVQQPVQQQVCVQIDGWSGRPFEDEEFGDTIQTGTTSEVAAACSAEQP